MLYLSKIRERLESAHKSPDDSFVNWIMGETYQGEGTRDKLGWFAGLVREVLKDFRVDDQARETSTHLDRPGPSQVHSVPASQPDSSKQSPKLLRPSPPDDWISLSDDKMLQGINKPLAIRVANGDERPIKSWKGILIEVAEYLIRSGQLTADVCPIGTGPRARTNYLVNVQPRQVDGRGFHTPSTLSKRSALRNCIQRCKYLTSNQTSLHYLARTPLRFAEDGLTKLAARSLGKLSRSIGVYL